VPVPLTPPGDAFPAVGKSLDTLRESIDASYGPGIGRKLLPDDKLAVMNVIPAADRAVEVIVDGLVLGRSFYDPSKESWIFKPTLEGARRMAPLTSLKRITVDIGAEAAILKGGSLLAPGVVSADASIKAGDEVFLLDLAGEVFGVGTARMSGEEMLESKHGLASKVREVHEPVPPTILPGGQTWEDAVRANAEVLSRREEEAISFIRRTAARNRMPRCVAFSGGKDSLCVLLLVRKALKEFKIVFIDTGIEFPETVQYTRRVIESLGMKDRLIVRSVGDRFWEAMKIFGPPSRDARWCCKVCKLGPTTSLIQEVFGGSCLTFVGQRRYESRQRHDRKRVTRNPWVPGQLAASPIKGWTAMHVWLYALREGAEMNPLYFRGYSRVGCSVCPASDMAELRLLEETHPDIASRLASEIRRHGEETDAGEDWIRLGLWRWRRKPAWAREEAPGVRLEGIELPAFIPTDTSSGTLLASQTSRGVGQERMANSLKALGKVTIENGEIHVSTSRGNITLGEDGTLTIGPARDEKGLRRIGRLAGYCLVKAEHCVGCGTCVGACPRGAITISGGKAWIGDECTHCGSCIQLCPLLTWAVKEPAKPFA